MITPSIQLVSAIFADNSSKIRSLLDLGVVHVNDSLFSDLPPLLRAALYGKPEALRTLIECGADTKAKDMQGRTALELAKKYNHQKIVEILLQN